MPRSMSRAIVCLLTLTVAACARSGEPSALPPTAGPTTSPSPAPSATALPRPTVLPTRTPAPPPLTWEQLRNATYPLPEEDGGPEGGVLPMEDGQFTWVPVPGSASANRYLVYPGVAFGDVDGDQVNDAVVVILNVSAGSGNFYHLAPVLNDGGQARPLQLSFIGDRVIVDQVRVLDGAILLRFMTYRPEEPFGSTPTLRVARQYALRQGALELLSEEELNADEVVSETEVREVVPITLPEGGGMAVYTGTTEPFGLDEFRVDGAAGQAVTVTVSSPHEDVSLSILALSIGQVLVRAQDEVSTWRGSFPATGEYAVNVFAIGSQTTYRLTIEVAAPPADPTATPDALTVPSATEEGGGVIYLTFDDGPLPPYTHEMLDLLAQYDAHVTFFVLGQNAQTHTELLDAAYQSGHSLGNHTWTHRSLAGISQEEFDSELQQTAAVLGPRGSPCMRPPYGATDSFTRAFAAELGYEVILWNIDTLDWRRPGADAIVSTVTQQACPGAIVLMHDGGGDRTQTVAALEIVLRGLTDRGYSLEALCH